MHKKNNNRACKSLTELMAWLKMLMQNSSAMPPSGVFSHHTTAGLLFSSQLTSFPEKSTCFTFAPSQPPGLSSSFVGCCVHNRLCGEVQMHTLRKYCIPCFAVLKDGVLYHQWQAPAKETRCVVRLWLFPVKARKRGNDNCSQLLPLHLLFERAYDMYRPRLA